MAPALHSLLPGVCARCAATRRPRAPGVGVEVDAGAQPGARAGRDAQRGQLRRRGRPAAAQQAQQAGPARPGARPGRPASRPGAPAALPLPWPRERRRRSGHACPCRQAVLFHAYPRQLPAPALTTVTRLIASPRAALPLRALAGGRATLHAEAGQRGPPVAPVRRARLAAGRGALASRTGCSSCGAARPWAGAVAGVAAAAAARARALAITRT